jgi:hypothetical protein
MRTGDTKAGKTNAYQGFKRFEQHRKSLTEIILQQREILNALGMAQWAESLILLEQRLLSDAFRVLVIGEFKRGKSTFINALLGQEILPSHAVPCTAIINEVKWGEKPRALVHFKNEQAEVRTSPIEIPIDQLTEYVAIQNMYDSGEAGARRQIRESPYEKVQLFWPLDLCHNGVEIIDSPGLNESEVREKITMDYLKAVDAVIFVMMCSPLGSLNEMDTIKNVLLPAGHEEIFFICNHYDQVRKGQRDDVRRFGIAKLGPFTKRPDHIFFVSSLQALEGRLENDLQRVEESGIREVEMSLEHFLTRDRGRVKLIRPVHELRASIRAARNTIPNRMAMLQTDQETLRSRFAAAQQALQTLEVERDQIVEQIAVFRANLTEDVGEKARVFYEDTIQNVAYWASALTVEEENSIFFMSEKPPKEQVEQLVEIVCKHLSSRVENALATWIKDDLQNFVEEQLNRFQGEVNGRVRVFLEEVDKVYDEVAHGADKERRKPLSPHTRSPLDRLIAGIGTVDIAGPGAGISSGTGMFVEVFKASTPSILLGSLALVMSAWNPLVLGGMMITALISVKKRGDRVTQEIKQQVGDKFASCLSARISDEIHKIAECVTENIRSIEAATHQELGKQLQQVGEQAESVLKEMQQGQDHIEEKVSELDVLRTRLDGIDADLDNLIGLVVS